MFYEHVRFCVVLPRCGRDFECGVGGVGGRPTNAIDDAAVSKYHNNRSLINICTNRGRSARARRRGVRPPKAFPL